MKVLVKLLPPLSNTGATEEQQVNLPEGSNLDDVVVALQLENKLSQSITSLEYLALDNGDNLISHNKKLREGDVIKILPPMAGG